MQKMDQLQLRDYQQECLNEHFRYFEHNTGNPLFVVPTGGGKSLIISEFLKVIFNTWKNQKVLILTHVKELIQQNYDEFCRHWGLLAPVGIYSAGLNRRDLHKSAIFGGIQSVFNKAEEFGKVDLILIDEAHLCPKKGQGRYRSFIEDCRQINPSLKVLGYTATPYRLDGGYLHEGEGRIFTDVAYEVFLETLIEQKHLVPLVAKRTVNAIDTSKVGTQTGDFKHNELEQAAMASGCVEAAVKELVDRAREEKRKHWLVFGCGHDHAHDILNHLALNGIYAQIILSTTPKDERRQIIKDAKEGKTTAIVNVSVLTTGFDWPRCDLLAVMRPTQSVSLYVQMMGRGMRTFPGKYNCIAEGQRVLTDRGLVPIELVQLSDLLWDGESWVQHNGVVCKGIQRVIHYVGLYATEDHNVWTEQGWQLFGVCAKNKIGIACTGDGRSTIRETDGCSSQNREKGIEAENLSVLPMRFVWESRGEGDREYPERSRGLQGVWFTKGDIEMAIQEMCRSATEMLQPERSAFCGLRVSRNQIQIQGAHCYGGLDPRESRAAQGEADRQDRQRRSLRAWESAMGNCEPKPDELQVENYGRVASIPACLSQSSICRWNNQMSTVGRDVVRGDRGSVLEHGIVQTERRVWDILNAGPRHRFTVEGLLVSNCLVLDYGTNVMRHGPINRVRVKGANKADPEEEYEPRARECPECGMILEPEIKRCPGCGYDFPTRDADHEKIAGTEDPIDFSVPNSTPATPVAHEVLRVYFDRHTKTDKPDSMRVSYQCGMREFREWICFEHGGYARLKASKWWLEHGSFPVPPTVTEAMERRGELRLPKSITIREEGKFDRIINRHFPIGMEEPIQSSMPAKITVEEDETEIPF